MSTGTAPDAGSSVDPRRPLYARTEGISERKADHLQICTDPQEYLIETGDSAFGSMRFLHRALPELDAGRIDTSLEFLGSRISLPIFISCMTGGSEGGGQVNRNLARAAEEARIPVGAGSIRILFRDEAYFDQFYIKPLAPDVPVIANLGAVQLRDIDNRAVGEMLKRLEVQALSVHLNAGQELFQPGGDRDFTGLFDGISRFCERSPVPVIVKETGFGMRPSEILRLLASGVAYVDLAGAGGTNWLRVESYRSGTEAITIAEQFDDWGISTGVLLAALKERGIAAPVTELPERRGAASRAFRRQGLSAPPSNGALAGKVLASGGVRSGMDVAKCVALGAEIAGLALPFARAVHEDGVAGALKLIEELDRGLRGVMTLTGCRTVAALKKAPLMMDAPLTHAVGELLAADSSDPEETLR